ncbi:unnamed protein product, partial [Symbiodinium pilosum]
SVRPSWFCGVADDGLPAEDQPIHRVSLPGANASSSSSDKFAGLVSQELEAGRTVELLPHSPEAAWHLVRAFSIGQRAAEFEVCYATESDGRTRSLRVLARSGPEWSDVSKDLFKGYFVSRSTMPSKLAQKLELELRDKSSVAVHTFVDAAPAAMTMLEALAAVPSLAAKDDRLLCTAASVEGETPRLIIHARTPTSWAESSRAAEGSFVAYPPGQNASKEDKKTFWDTVHTRLQPGNPPVVMQCRGASAAWHALEALALKKGVTAEVEASWVDYTHSGQKGRALHLLVTTGQSWTEFNSTDFHQTALLKAGDQPQVRQLSQAIAGEVGKRGATSIHMFVDNVNSVYQTLKAIASVPAQRQSAGRRVVFVPSFGWFKGPDGEKSRRVLRLYAKQRSER